MTPRLCTDTYLWVVILLPVTNAIVRWRLEYRPNASIALPVDASDGAEGAESPRMDQGTPSLLQTGRRIYKSEGLRELYRGLIPVVLCLLIAVPAVNMSPILFCPSPWQPVIKYFITPGPLTYNRLMPEAIFANFWFGLALIWIYRLIGTPSKLSVYQSSLKESLSGVFSPYELSNKLFPILVTPGIPAAFLINIVWRIQVVRPLHELLEPLTWGNGPLGWTYATIGYLSLWTISTAMSAPLDMAVTRLAVQKNAGRVSTWKSLGWKNRTLFILVLLLNAGVGGFVFYVERYRYPRPGDGRVQLGVLLANATTFLDAVLVFYASWMACRNRDVVPNETENENTPSPREILVEVPSAMLADSQLRTRDEQEPYTGLYHCMRTIVREEGWATLYRGWWITALGLLVSV